MSLLFMYYPVCFDFYIDKNESCNYTLLKLKALIKNER